MDGPRRRAGANRRAVNRTVRRLRQSGDLAESHQALVQLACSLADAVDDRPGDAQLWREYRYAVAELTKLGSHEPDALTGLLDRLRAPLGDAKD